MNGDGHDQDNTSSPAAGWSEKSSMPQMFIKCLFSMYIIFREPWMVVSSWYGCTMFWGSAVRYSVNLGLYFMVHEPSGVHSCVHAEVEL